MSTLPSPSVNPNLPASYTAAQTIFSNTELLENIVSFCPVSEPSQLVALCRVNRLTFEVASARLYRNIMIHDDKSCAEGMRLPGQRSARPGPHYHLPVPETFAGELSPVQGAVRQTIWRRVRVLCVGSVR